VIYRQDSSSTTLHITTEALSLSRSILEQTLRCPGLAELLYLQGPVTINRACRLTARATVPFNRHYGEEIMLDPSVTDGLDRHLEDVRS
jgi:hypothetical protein